MKLAQIDLLFHIYQPDRNTETLSILGFNPRDLYLDNDCYAAMLVSYNSDISRVIKALEVF